MMIRSASTTRSVRRRRRRWRRREDPGRADPAEPLAAPLFSMHDEPFSPALQTEREEPALFATPRQSSLRSRAEEPRASTAAPEPVAKTAAETPSAPRPAESAVEDDEDFLSSAQPPAAALRAKAPRRSLARARCWAWASIQASRCRPSTPPSTCPRSSCARASSIVLCLTTEKPRSTRRRSRVRRRRSRARRRRSRAHLTSATTPPSGCRWPRRARRASASRAWTRRCPSARASRPPARAASATRAAW